MTKYFRLEFKIFSTMVNMTGQHFYSFQYCSAYENDFSLLHYHIIIYKVDRNEKIYNHMQKCRGNNPINSLYLGMECGNVNNTNYRCKDFTTYFSSGKEMCETFFPEQLMGEISSNFIKVEGPGGCITPGRDPRTIFDKRRTHWFERFMDPLH